jgi:hypothetical protein
MRNTFALIAVTFLAVACKDKTPAPSDSALANDLAMAQRPAVAPTVFNDAPVGASAPASRAQGAPDRKPEPPKTSQPTPRPSPRRENPPAPVAQAPVQTPPQPVATAQAPAPAPSAAQGIIGTGASVGMQTNAKVCTASLLPGDKFTATVTSGTTGSNGAAIPPGATVVLEVAGIQRADPIESSRVDFRVRSVEVNGEPYPVSGDVAQLGRMQGVTSSDGKEKEKIIGGAVAGAVLGRIFGKSTKATVIGAAAGTAAGAAAAKAGQSHDACLPEGSPLRLTIGRDIVVKRSAL